MSEPLSPLETEAIFVSNTPITPGTPLAPVTPETPSSGKCPKPPLASREMFFPLSFCSPPASVTAPPGPLQLPSPTSTSATPQVPATEYGHAVARVKSLDAFLTPSMRSTLNSMLSVMEMHLLPPEGLATHSLISRIASREQTPDDSIKDIVDIIEKGLLIFAALGGGSVKKSENGSATGSRKEPRLDSNGNPIKSTHRSLKIRTDCKARDPTCQICNSNNTGQVSHIIPYSVKDGKAVDFWKFVELFLGVEATAALKAVALAPNPEIVDNMKNVWFLCSICHDNFDRAKLCIIPDLDDLTYPYDPALTSSYKATVEFPSGKKRITIACWKVDEDGELSIDGKLNPGHVISLTTENASGLPLPHPLLFQLHAIISRVIGLKAAAGFPLFPNWEGRDPDDCGVPAFTDNTFVEWLAHHEQNTMDHDAVPDEDAKGRYDSGGAKPHIMRWFELTPLSVTHALSPLDHSDSDSDLDAYQPLKREHVEDSDTDEERPRKYTVVLSEVMQRMIEKRQLGMAQGMELPELA